MVATTKQRPAAAAGIAPTARERVTRKQSAAGRKGTYHVPHVQSAGRKAMKKQDAARRQTREAC